MVVEFKFPDVGEGIHEGTVVKLLVAEGDTVKLDQAILEMETDKAVVELPSPAAGVVLKLNFKEGEKVKVGEVIVTIGEEGEAASREEKHPVQKAVEKVVQAVKPKPPELETEHPKPETASRPLASPSTRKLARELGVNLELIQGTGPGGRILADDVRTKASGRVATREGPHVDVKEERITITTDEGEKRIPLTGLRKTIAERMSYSKTHIPEAVGMDFANVTRLVAIREREKIKAAKVGVHVTYLPFIIKAVVVALKKFPKFNAHFDEEKQEIVLKPKFNIAIAVDTENGLMAPVVKDVRKKSILDIAKEIESLAEKARTRKITLDEMRGGTFTITNVGSAGAMYSVPIINPPQIAIMGIHRIKDMPVLHKGKVKAGKVMGISLAFDHRVVDGAEATYFMNEVIRHLEDPDLLLLDMI
jgi:pyruvate dehydrogenase E2 component (dihydrolipoamide acetyltransferase)